MHPALLSLVIIASIYLSFKVLRQLFWIAGLTIEAILEELVCLEELVWGNRRK